MGSDDHLKCQACVIRSWSQSQGKESPGDVNVWSSLKLYFFSVRGVSVSRALDVGVQSGLLNSVIQRYFVKSINIYIILMLNIFSVHYSNTEKYRQTDGGNNQNFIRMQSVKL